MPLQQNSLQAAELACAGGGQAHYLLEEHMRSLCIFPSKELHIHTCWLGGCVLKPCILLTEPAGLGIALLCYCLQPYCLSSYSFLV